MGIESCIGAIEISGKDGSGVDVGSMSGLERQFERWK
jgi:hypothetical protein